MKLMLDYCLKNPKIIEALENDTHSDVVTTIDLGYRDNTSDDDLVRATVDRKRILVTKNYLDFDETKYPPCGHGGIIVFHTGETSASYVANRIKALIRSGNRRYVKGHVTHLYESKMEIYTHKDPIKVNFNDAKKLRDALKGN